MSEIQPIAAYEPFRAQLAELEAHNSTLVFDYRSSAGNKDARSHIYKLRQTKAALEKARKDAKADALEYGRQVDSQAKEITSRLEAMIDVHQKPLDEIEAQETARIERLKADLLEIQGGGERAAVEWMQLPLDAMRDRLKEIESDAYTPERWQEFLTEALIAKDKAIGTLREAIGKREKYDAEQAELAKLRAQAEAQAKKDREEQIAREAAERAKREAEEKAAAEKRAVEEKAKREKEAADKKLLEEKLRNERLEREKAEAEQRAQNAARETEERLKREAEAKAKKEADEAAKREANRKHVAKINSEAADALISANLSKVQAEGVIKLIQAGKVPHVRIDY